MKPYIDEKLIAAITEYAMSRKAPFTAKNIVMHIANSFKEYNRNALENIVEEVLSSNDNFYTKYTDGNPYLTFCRKSVFMKGAEFCYTPSDFEFKKGIVIPDDFFSLFIASPLLNAIHMLYLNKAPAVNTIRVKISKQQFSLFYPLTCANEDTITDQQLDIIAYDFTNFYSSTNFQKGDTILFRVEDYDKAILSFRKKSGVERKNTNAIKKWVFCLEQCLIKAFEEFGELLEAKDFLEQVLVNAPELLKDPPISFAEFLAATELIELKKSNSIKVFSRKINSSLEFDSQSLPISISSAPNSSIGDILDDIGLVLLPEIIVSYMKDALSRKSSLQSVYDRLLPFSVANFADEAQKISFEIFMEELWEQVSENYTSMADAQKAPLREKLLRLYDEILSAIRKIDDKQILLSQIPKKDFSQFSFFLSHLSDVIVNLETETKALPEQLLEEIDEILNSADEIRQLAQKIYSIPTKVEE